MDNFKYQSKKQQIFHIIQEALSMDIPSENINFSHDDIRNGIDKDAVHREFLSYVNMINDPKVSIAKQKQAFRKLMDLYESTPATDACMYNMATEYTGTNPLMGLKKLMSFVDEHFPNANMNWVDVSGMTTLEEFCAYCHNFNGDISEWNVSQVTTMKGAFAKSGFNGDISGWDVSNVENMGWMFEESAFNQPLASWKDKVYNCRVFDSMFKSCVYKQDLSEWNILEFTPKSNGQLRTSTTGMFKNETVVNRMPVEFMPQMYISNSLYGAINR